MGVLTLCRKLGSIVEQCFDFPFTVLVVTPTWENYKSNRAILEVLGKGD